MLNKIAKKWKFLNSSNLENMSNVEEEDEQQDLFELPIEERTARAHALTHQMAINTLQIQNMFNKSVESRTNASYINAMIKADQVIRKKESISQSLPAPPLLQPVPSTQSDICSRIEERRINHLKAVEDMVFRQLEEEGEK